MTTYDAWQFPDGETALPARMQRWNLRVDGRLTYQFPLYQRALAQCQSHGVAVDVGAHVGLFSYWMVRDFAQVVAFEPVASHRECWRMNVPHRSQDVLHACALGADVGSVRLEPVRENASGTTRITGEGPIHLRTLDNFALPRIDLLKIDCEGYERDVLGGATETIARCRPVVAVEQRERLVGAFGHQPTDAVRWLEQRGARVAWTDRSDYVMVFA